MPVYTPHDNLPVYPTYSTITKDGVKYKAYFETDWHQVITEDGVPLCQLLQSMPSINSKDFYKYRGILKSTPRQTAIDQLYEITSQQVGDIYLVETDMLVDGGYVCESYVWLDNESGWVYCGTTNRKASINRDLPEIVRLFPDEIGDPGQVLIVSKDGKYLTWGDITQLSVEGHDTSPTAHTDIREAINLKADKLLIFNDTLKTRNWVYNNTHNCFEYLYKNDKLPKNAYFEITAVINNHRDTEILTAAMISPIYEILFSEDKSPYTLIRAKRVPNSNIEICIKVFGTYQEI